MLISLNSPLTLPDVASGVSVDSSFQVKNASTTNMIQIITIKASCGCTLLNNNNVSTVSPLDVIDIPFTISTVNKKGYITKTITVTYEYNNNIETLHLKFNLNAL